MHERVLQTFIPIHALNFVDYDFDDNAEVNSSRIPNFGALPHERQSEGSSSVAQHERLIKMHCMLPDRAAAERVNPELDSYMRNTMSMAFVQLPYAKQLHELSKDSHGLDVWAALFAHAHPDTLSALPADVRRLPGVTELTDVLLKDSTRKALSNAVRHADMVQRDAEEMARLLFDESEGRAEAQGFTLGVAHMLRLQHISSVNAFKAKFGQEPDASTLAALQLLSDKPFFETR